MPIVIGLIVAAIILFIIFKLARRAANQVAAKQAVQILVLLRDSKRGLTIDEMANELKAGELSRGIIVNAVRFLFKKGLITGKGRVTDSRTSDLVSLVKNPTSRFVITPKGRQEITA